MNYGRLMIAAVVAAIVDFVYGFIAYGNVLSSQLAQFPGVFRSPQSQTSYLPILFLGILIGMFAITYIYAKGYEGGGLVEGVRFGIVVGIFNAGYVVMVGYAVMNIGRRLTASMAFAGLIEWIIVGLSISATYKPSQVEMGTSTKVKS